MLLTAHRDAGISTPRGHVRVAFAGVNPIDLLLEALRARAVHGKILLRCAA
ncbi:hypothetical protein [Sorangium sp. So ce887]|uniref:hypothetical protein n=1 Tax=Sorangium sp. So ce887 TaxID=3133324 RepID=UPI003F5E4CE7